ncbi:MULTISPECIES: transposase [unclassified Okeania]|uniref:transposase n=1 Tax=unclassified Okeania TaxID=2634635 RepID=UPI00338F0702
MFFRWNHYFYSSLSQRLYHPLNRVGDVKQRLQEIIFELCTENNWRLIALEIMPDHVHLFLEVDPNFCTINNYQARQR